jgi:hypothetical protein
LMELCFVVILAHSAGVELAHLKTLVVVLAHLKPAHILDLLDFPEHVVLLCTSVNLKWGQKEVNFFGFCFVLV